MGKTGIQWTTDTWNPLAGCDRVSAGCDHCYAATLHNRRYLAWKHGTFPTAPAQYHQPFWGKGGGPQLIPERLSQPPHWRKPRRVFVNSVSDLFHEDVPDTFIDAVLQVIAQAQRHTFQVLTKRPERMQETMHRWAEWRHALPGVPDVMPNLWLGVSVENQAEANNRIPLLLETPAAVRFLSCEPLLEEVNLAIASASAGLSLTGLQWVIIGGESGPRARPMDLAWIDPILSQCQALHIAPFVKQLGTVYARQHRCSERHAGDPAEWPEHLRVREWPQGAATEGSETSA